MGAGISDTRAPVNVKVANPKIPRLLIFNMRAIVSARHGEWVWAGMIEADKAYAAAKTLIERARRASDTDISFNIPECHALTRIPPEIATLRALRHVTFTRTNVIDLAPLAALTRLETLRLNQTGVKDLAPLGTLTELQILRLSQTGVTDINPLATLTGLQTLTLDQTGVTDLAPLANLTGLQALFIDQTGVTDLKPLAKLIGLRDLPLDATNVNDLRPLRDMRKLGTNRPPGLTYHNTPATARDADLARLAVIEDPQDRAEQTLSYLRSLPPWPAPYTPRATPDGSPPQPIGTMPTPPEQDPALPLIWGEHGFAFFAGSIASDPVTEAALDDLRALLEDLRRKGNRHDDLYRIAGELQERSSGAVSELNMVKLHLSFQKLRRLHAGRAARQDTLDDETVTTIDGVLDILPGVTLADDGVRVLIERQEAERARSLTDAEAKASARVLEHVQEADAPFAPEVKDVAAEVLKPEAEDRLAATRGILSRNVVVQVLKYVGGIVIGGAIGGPVGTFVYEHGPDLLAYAVTMGDDALIWAQSVMAKFRVEYELFMGIAREITGTALPPKHKDPRRGGGL